MLEQFHIGKAETRMLDQDGDWFCSLVGQKVGLRIHPQFFDRKDYNFQSSDGYETMPRELVSSSMLPFEMRRRRRATH